MSFENANNHSPQWSEAVISQSGLCLPSLPVGLKCKVLLACVDARRQREQQRRSTARGMLVSVLVILCLVGFDAVQTPYFDTRSSRLLSVVQLENQRAGSSSSAYSISEDSFAAVNTWDYVEHFQAAREHQKSVLFGMPIDCPAIFS